MKQLKNILLLVLLSAFTFSQTIAQCALCTKTAAQLGDGPASGLNNGILYLMSIPLCLLFYIGYRWYQRERFIVKNENPNPNP
ncbi:hypothetical protein [Arachidicoccus sp.]|jgi:hypothetical protein|uniref:hypothetical protein n=1 Tax=Arachidicoccus sp. TaxID=1872624 RepID=UPI003D1DBA64